MKRFMGSEGVIPVFIPVRGFPPPPSTCSMHEHFFPGITLTLPHFSPWLYGLFFVFGIRLLSPPLFLPPEAGHTPQVPATPLPFTETVFFYVQGGLGVLVQM